MPTLERVAAGSNPRTVSQALALIVCLYTKSESSASFGYRSRAQSAMRGMGAVVAGMVIATGLKLAPALRNNPLGFGLGLIWAGLAFVCVALLRWPLVWVLIVLGGLSCFWAYRQLKRLEQTT